MEAIESGLVKNPRRPTTELIGVALAVRDIYAGNVNMPLTTEFGRRRVSVARDSHVRDYGAISEGWRSPDNLAAAPS